MVCWVRVRKEEQEVVLKDIGIHFLGHSTNINPNGRRSPACYSNLHVYFEGCFGFGSNFCSSPLFLSTGFYAELTQ